MPELYNYKATIIRVTDGDTVTARVDLGFQIDFTMPLRLYGINTPEIFGVAKDSEEYKKGMEAKAFVEGAVLGKDVILKTYKDSKDKYGRYLADIILPDGSVLNTLLVERGLAERKTY